MPRFQNRLFHVAALAAMALVLQAGTLGCGDEETQVPAGDDASVQTDGGQGDDAGASWDEDASGEADSGPHHGEDASQEDAEIPPRCGDGILQPSIGEACDDGNEADGDGCAADCSAVEPGWTCPTPGYRCRAARCGDGIVAGNEECDRADDPGCVSCKVVQGYVCPQDGSDCRKTVCGDGVREGAEGCDNGAGGNVWTDGCTPDCRQVLSCAAPAGGLGQACTAPCGSGMMIPGDTSKECDDGNLMDGDGCSSDCKVEGGWTCQVPETSEDALVLPVLARDFFGAGLAAGGYQGPGSAHPDFQNTSAMGFSTDALRQGNVREYLDADGKPEFLSAGKTLSTAENFRAWFRNDPAYNIPIPKSVVLAKDPGSGAYAYIDPCFFPINGEGWVAAGAELTSATAESVIGGSASALCADGRLDGKNFSFTTELRYWFQFKGGEVLEFYGDDDTWVYVNNRLALDLGGIHPKQRGVMTLNGDGTITSSYPERSDIPDVTADFGLVAGKVYQIVVFQAERSTNGSGYRLTLNGFNAGTSRCDSICGDGIVTQAETCDDGMELNGKYGFCDSDCQGFVEYCGDGVVHPANGETCDDGPLNGTYGHCASDCSGLGPRCGDGIVQEAGGEVCDDGALNGTRDSDCLADCTRPFM